MWNLSFPPDSDLTRGNSQVSTVYCLILVPEIVTKPLDTLAEYMNDIIDYKYRATLIKNLIL